MTWPKSLPWYTAKDFAHGCWCDVLNDIEDGIVLPDSPDRLSPAELEDHACETECCLVGNVRHAWGLPADPHYLPLPVEGQIFLKKLCEIAGKPISAEPEHGYSAVERAASRVFETGDNRGTGHDVIGTGSRPMSPRDAARYYQKTLKFFDYECS